MNILIDIKNGEIRLYLKKKDKIVDELSFCDERNLTEKLLPEIDKLLKRNKLDISDVVNSHVDSDQSDSFTSTRIAKTVAQVITEMKA